MSILVAIKSLASDGGGAERVLSTYVEGLCDRGHRVTLLTFDKPGSSSFYSIDPRSKRVDLGNEKLAGSASLSVLAGRIRLLRSFTREHRFDVAIGFMHSVYVPLACALVGHSTPLLSCEHTVREYYNDRKLEFVLVRIATRLSDRFSVVSERVAKSFPSSFDGKTVILPNPVAIFSGGRPSRGVIPAIGRQLRVLSAGRLVELKDHEVLIRAFYEVSELFSTWELRIIGDGELRPHLEKLIATLGLGDRVSLPGFTANIADEYEAADLFVHPSRYESFGMATAEAAAAGLPCIGFADCPGTNEIIIDAKTGILADGNDRVDSLREALKALMSNPGLRAEYGQAAIQRAAEFSPKACLDRLELLLYEMQASRLTPPAL